MQSTRMGLYTCLVALTALGVPVTLHAEIILGEPPTAPADVSGLPGAGPRAQGVTGGFTVNTASREEVRSFYNAVFQSSEGVAMETTANVASCTPGTNGTAFKEAVLRRINWYRAMAGVPAGVTFEVNNNAADQQAAVLMSANIALSHTPPSTWFCWAASGSNAANRSNLALGSSGPGAAIGYMRDHGANNAPVGHRRWLLYPQTQVMGTGDVPAANGLNAANAVWVFDANLHGPRPVTRDHFVAWPPPGFVPYQTVYPRWSFSLSNTTANVNFSAASVTMRSNGVNVAVSVAANQTGVGENSVVWVPMGLDANNQNTVFPFNGTDTVYTVTVTNIQIGASTTGFTYTVTVFDPNLPGADYAPPLISGPSQPVVGLSNLYTFTGLSYASSYEWRATRASNFNFFDGAEAGLNNFTTNTSPGYAVRDNSYRFAGTYSFRLAHMDTSPILPPDQLLTLKQVFVPKTNGTLILRSRLGYAGDGETAHIQISTDGGVSWQDIYSQIGNNSEVEGSFVSRSFPLSAFASKTAQLRFAYTYTPPLSFFEPQSGLAVGWYLDDITITNAEVWTVIATNTATTTNFTFNPPQPTNYSLNVRAILYDEFPLEWGPTKTVNATTNVPAVIVMSRPVLTNGQVQLAFTLTAGSSATFKLLQADRVNGPWTTNASATLITNVPGSSYRFNTTVGPASRFYRVKAP